MDAYVPLLAGFALCAEKFALTERGVGPADSSSGSVFMNWPLAGKLRNATRVKIQVPAFHNGQPVFEFDLSGIDVGRLN
jgi:hypothetical protein